jgi:hypothetical protein
MTGSRSVDIDLCDLCADPADVVFRERLYCARCALEHTIDRLREEAAVSRSDETRYERLSSALPHLGDQASGINGRLMERSRRHREST